MKRIILGLLCLVGVNSYGQIPEGYYSSTNGLEGVKLKDALYDLIKGHKEYYYTSSSIDTWDILKEADGDAENQENVILIYSGESVNGEQEYNNGNGWTREHVWAKSRGDFGTDKGAGTDCHNLKACSASVNSTRSNRAFDEGGSEVWYNHYFTGCYKGADYTFEPRDAVKGDIARIIFYMATRYNGDDGEPDLDLTGMVLPSTDKQPIHGIKSVLLKWHEEDPVDGFEIKRNNVVYSFQENRNPYVDHPEFVDLIWGSATAVSIVENDDDLHCICIGGVLQMTSSTEFYNVDVYNLSGQKVLTNKASGSREMDIRLDDHGLFLIVVDDKRTIKVNL